MNDTPEAKTANEFYQGLDQRELAAVAGSCSLSVEDVQQEARLLCLMIAAGRSDHDPAVGPVRQYVMGRLWGMTLRWQAPVLLGHGEGGDGEEPHSPGDAPWERALFERSPYTPDPGAADPLQVLLAREHEREYRAACGRALAKWVEMERLTAGERTFLDLIIAGAPVEEIAALYGLTPRAVRYRCDRLLEKLQDARGAARKDRPASPG